LGKKSDVPDNNAHKKRKKETAMWQKITSACQDPKRARERKRKKKRKKRGGL
jgi:hypothetical protein